MRHVNRKGHVRTLALLTAGPCLLMAGSGSAGPPAFRTIALSGDAAPGTGHVFTHLAMVVINGTGQGAIVSGITGESGGPCDRFGDPPPEEGIWSEGTGELALVARRGMHAPGADPEVVFNGFDGLVLNDAGWTAFLAFLTGMEANGDCANAGNNVGVWSEGSGGLGLVAVAGMAAPRTTRDTVFDNFSIVRFNDAGQTAFSGVLRGAAVNLTNNRGLWSDRSGTLDLIARSGSHAPGTAPAVVFEWFGSGSPVLNASGQVAFRAALVGADVDDSNRYGIWTDTAGALALVIRSGDPAPGTEPGVVFQWLGSPRLNDFGNLAFLATLAGPGITEANDVGIWSDAPGTLTLVARTGSPAPGVAADFTSLDEPVLNSAGQTAFRGFTGTGVSGVWSEGPGALALVAHTGDPAPGTTASFAGFSQTPAYSGVGHTAFWAVLSGAGVTSSNDTGLWAEDPTGELALVVREGDLLEVAPGDERSFTWLSLVGGSGEAGRSSGLNDNGQVAFQASFTDLSSGVFVASFCPVGDITDDCHVGVDDLIALLAAWGPCPVGAACPADLNHDGTVDVDDLLIVILDWEA